MNTNRWTLLETDADLPLMSQVLGISQITANVMANRGIRTKNTALSFLTPTMDKLHDITSMKGVNEALALISQAIHDGTKVMIYGDYDVDGIMSTVILYKVLKNAGADVDFYIPHRVEEGYGLNSAVVKRLHEAGTQLLITVDNGISAISEIDEANNLGMKVIIIDHHEPGFTHTQGTREDILPPAAAIVDPKQAQCTYPFKELCAAGLSYKLAVAFEQYHSGKHIQHDELLALAAIATICDIVNMQDENRIIVREGLARLNANKLLNPGLGSLISRRNYLDKPIDTFTVGFIIGPCLNATGRLDSAAKSVELLLATESNERHALANELCELNDARKELTAECVSRVMESISEPLDKVLVLTDLSAHESVAGIVAGRIKESTGRPTILLTQGDGTMKGSGRSVEGYNLFEALYAHRHLFTRFGGHPMAAGLTLHSENIPLLREALNANCTLSEDDFTPEYKIDRELLPSEITLALSEELKTLAPYGKGNHDPLFVSRKLYVENCRVISEKNTLIFTFNTKSGKLKGIAFGLNSAFDTATLESGVRPTGGFNMDVVYVVETNVYNGISSVQMRLRDFRLFK
ncbi:MAG: single-stranded-DNA-specific exonuclease RecJ [Defluviitaleaceae bacterium]|nr:single-stranded-DNA-specific exonuclease RecJ [Defluviitaleaceae bacterium]